MPEEINNDPLKNLKFLHQALAGDEYYKENVPQDFNEFVKIYSQPENARNLHAALAGDDYYKENIPENFEEAVKLYALPVGKPSPTPQGGNGLGTQKNVGQTAMGSQEPSMYSPSSAPQYLSPEELGQVEQPPMEEVIQTQVTNKPAPTPKEIEPFKDPKVQDALRLEYLKKKAAESKKVSESYKGNMIGALWNSAAESYSNTVDKALYSVLSVMATVMPEGVDGGEQMTTEERFKEVEKSLKDLGMKETLDDALKSKGTTKEYAERKKVEGGPIVEGVFGLGESLYPMMTPMQSGFFMTTFADSHKEIREEMPDISPEAQFMYAATQGTVVMLLNEAGLSNLVQNKSVMKNLTGKVVEEIKRMGAKVSPEVLESTTAKIVNGFFAEAETGASEYVAQESIKQIADALEGEKDAFEFEGWQNFISNTLYAGAIEGIGGSVLKSLGEAAGSLKSSEAKAKAEQDIAQVSDMVNDLSNPNVTPQAKEAIKKTVDQKAEEILEAYTEEKAKIDGLSPEVAAEFMAANDQVQSANAVLQDPNVSESTKMAAQQMLDNLTKRIDEIIAEAKPKVEEVAVVEEAQVETPSIEAQVAEIKSKPLTRIEGAGMGSNQAVGTFVSTEPENRYAAQFPDAEVQQMEVDIENPFVTEDTNLIDYRNEMINRRKGELDETDFTEVEIPSGEFTIDDLSDSGIEKVAAMVTEEMKAKGYDSIYFPQVGAQEGELVVFDREKVRRKGEAMPTAEGQAQQTTAAPDKSKPNILLSGAAGGFKRVSENAFDLRTLDGIRESIDENVSFAKIFEYKGKKYVGVGLVLSMDSQRGNPNGRNNYSFAVAELNESTPSDIVQTLENSARENFKNIYRDFSKNDSVSPIENIDAELSNLNQPVAEAKTQQASPLADVESTAKALEDINWNETEKYSKWYFGNEPVLKEYSTAEEISEAYHKAKADGSNPELVQAVEQLFAPQQQQTTRQSPATEAKAKKSDKEIELRMSEIEGDPNFSQEFSALEKEMEARERASVFGVKLSEVESAVNSLMDKEKNMPNGFGSFIEKRDARETKDVAKKYLNASSLSDIEVLEDFKNALLGNPDTWYADGLKLRESMNEASRRGINTSELISNIEKEFEKDGYTTEEARSVVANRLSKILNDSNTQQDATQTGEIEQSDSGKRAGTTESQQGQQENRIDQEGDVAQAEGQTGGGNIVAEGGEKKEIAIEDIDDTTVDKTDQTIIAYHATPTGKVSTGKEAGIHIGTKKAAEQVKAGRNQGKGKVEKVKTIIKRPLILSDMPSWSSANLLSQLFNPQTGQYFGLTRNDIRDIRDSDMTEKQKQQSVIDFLKKKGYDAIAYKNDSEDDGSYSYVLFEEPTIESGSTISEGVGQTQAETQQEVTGTYGNEGEVKFADGVILNHKFKLIEADDMQPSHLVSGQRNPKHLIALAQPKERNDQGSRVQQDKIADNPRLQEVGDSPIAYTGAPIVNKRGEVIQGNNRSLGLKKHYDINGTSYKQQLAENAEKFGLTKEQVMAMKNPILVREVAASDQTAIVLGNYDVKDIETGGKQRIDPIVTSRKIKPSDRQKLTTLVFDGDKTVKEAIRDSAREIATIVKSYINPAQMKTAFSSSGDITASGMDDIEGIMNSFLYEDGPASLPEVFSSLPNVVQKGVQKGIPSLVSVDPEKSLLKDVQNAMTAAYEYIQSGADNFDVWSRNVDMFLGVSPQELFSPLELDLANKMLTAKKQSDIANIFKQYQANVTDQPAGLFDEAVPGLSKKDAIAKQFNLEYNETNDIKGTGADRVAPALRQEGQPNEQAENGIAAEEDVNVEVEQPEAPVGEGEGEAVELPTEEQREEIEEDGFAMPTDEEMAAKREEIQTDLQKAIQDVKDKFSDLFNQNMGIIYDPKVEARKLYNFHVSLVNLAKQAIRSGVTTATDFAKLIGKRLDKFTERAFNDAMNDINGLPMIINSEEQMLSAEYQRVAESYQKQYDDAKKLKKSWSKTVIENINKAWFDANYVAKRMLNNAGAFEAVKRKNLLGGVSAKAVNQYKGFKKEIFGGLNKKEKILLNNIIQARTIISIDSRYDANGKPRIKHPGDTNKEAQTIYLGELESSNPKMFAKLNDRAQKYFDAQKELLDERLKEGRISIQQYQGMIDNDYSPRVFLEYLIDDVESGSGLASGGGKNVGKGDIKSLSDGDVNSLFHNAEWLLATNVLATSRSVFHNRANRSLYDFAKANPNNGFIEIQQPNGINKETGQPTYKDPKSDQRQVQFFEDGVRKSMLVSRDFGESWNNNNPLLSPQFANAIRLGSGGTIKRLFATGINPLFALSNFPRDVAHALFFTNAYSPTFPIALAQISGDLVRTAKDAWKPSRGSDKKGRYYKYLEQGGGMDYLSTQGLPFEQQTLLQSSTTDAINALISTVGYINQSSEIWVRLAIRERETNKGIAKFAKDNGRMPSLEERAVIEEGATEVSRSQMDFSQGGSWAKALDSLIPYLNASLQGLRVSGRYARENPKVFAYKIAQALAISAAIAAYNMRFKDDYDDLDDEEKNRNIIFMLDLTKTVDGKKGRAYIRIPKNQSSQWIFAMGELMGESMVDGKFRMRNGMSTLETIAPPLNPQNIPLVDALFMYQTGYDRFKGKYVVSPDYKGKPYAEYDPKKTEMLWRDIGELTGMSPDRLSAATGKLTADPNNNMIWTVVTEGYDKLIRSVPKEEQESVNDMAVESIEKILSPVQRKFLNYSNPNSKAKSIRELEEDEATKIKLQNDTVKTFVRKYINDEVSEAEVRSDFGQWLATQPKDSVNVKRLKSRFENSIRFKDLDNVFYRMTETDIPVVKARILYEYYKGLKTDNEREVLLFQAKNAPNVPKDTKSDFWKEFNRLKANGEE